jgi:hypothetical protein
MNRRGETRGGTPSPDVTIDTVGRHPYVRNRLQPAAWRCYGSVVRWSNRDEGRRR